jgi:hypothetical protein
MQTFSRWKPDGTKCPHTSLQDGTGIVVHYGMDGTIESNESFYMGDIDYGRPSELNETNTFETINIVESLENNSSSDSTIIEE